MKKMKEGTIKAYKIIYRDIMDNEKEYIWELGYYAEDLLMHRSISDIKQYISTGKWVKRKEYEKKEYLPWGLNIMGIEVSNKTQHTYYYDVAKKVAYEIAKECVKDMNFAKCIHKEALRRANRRDKIRNEKMFSQGNEKAIEMDGHKYRNELQNARHRNMHNLKKNYFEQAAREYQKVIEEYEIYSLCGIEPYEGEIQKDEPWWKDLKDAC